MNPSPPARSVTEDCVMDVFVLVFEVLYASGHEDPLGGAAELTARIIARVDEDMPARPRRPIVPSRN